MKLGLCMVVKNEAEQMADCLGDIHDLFDDIVVVDTGSTDGTRALLGTRFGITPISYDQTNGAGFLNFSAARNIGVSRIRTPWVLALDADERIVRRDLEGLRALDLETGGARSVAGYHCKWWNHDGSGVSFLDYKLPLFQRDLRYSGVIHESVRHDIRAHGRQAGWLDVVTIHHYPNPRRADGKAKRYREVLLAAIREEPTWYRYHWFLGYMCFRAGQLAEACRYLQVAAEARSSFFPVECLNSSMVLAEIRARQGAGKDVERTLRAALAFFEAVGSDFEVMVNFRLRQWLVEAWTSCVRGDLAQIRAYDFAS